MAKKPTHEELEQRVKELEQEAVQCGQVEEALRKTNTQFTTLVESIPDAIYFKDSQGRHVLVNKAFGELIGLGREKTLGKTHAELLPPDLAEQCSRSDEEAVGNRKPTRFEEEMTDDKGNKSFFETIKVPLLDNQGSVTGLIGITRDITERKQAEDALRESEENFRALADNANDGIVIITAEGVHAYANTRASEILGYSIGELLKIKFDKLFGPEELKAVHQRFERRIKGKDIPERSFETTLVRKDGKTVEVWATGAKTIWRGQPAVISIVRDITERRQAEDALRESEAKYKALVESSIDGIVVAQGKEICFANPSMIGMFGCTDPDEMVGHSFIEFVSPEYRQLMVERGLAREKGEIVPSRYEYKALRKDGTAFDAEVSVKKIVYEGKSARQGVIRNISSQKQAEKELKRKIVELDSFVNNIPDMAWVKDANSRFVLANKAFGEAVGMAPDTIANQTCEVCFGKQAANKFREDDLKVMKGGRQTVIEEKITDSQKKEIWLETIKSPILDNSGSIIGTVGVARDITKRKQTEEALQKAHDTLEKQVERRTSQLQDANERLERVNTGLQVLMEHRQEEVSRLRENIVENANKLITPYIEKMDKKRMSAKNSAYLEVIASGLKELVSPFANTLSSKEVVLSPTEVRVADLIRQGKTSKEIASLMNVSANAITVHRYNIRRKLGLLNKKVNLRSYLQSLST